MLPDHNGPNKISNRKTKGKSQNTSKWNKLINDPQIEDRILKENKKYIELSENENIIKFMECC